MTGSKKAGTGRSVPAQKLARTSAQAQALMDRVETQLRAALPALDAQSLALHRAMHHAVFPGGKRIRPRLLVLVATCCAANPSELQLAMLGACSVELIHSASLVHDDLPCFDNASTRRGKPSVHAAFGEPLAVLTGDALLVLAFQLLGETPPRLAQRGLKILQRVGSATGGRHGIICGQSLEEGRTPVEWSATDVHRYHTLKTAALFRLSTEAGAIAAGAADVEAWGEVGQNLGLAFQVADDLSDVLGSHAMLGKPTGRDQALGRPNAVAQLGESRARALLVERLDQVRSQVHALTVEPLPLLQMLDEVRALMAPILP